MVFAAYVDEAIDWDALRFRGTPAVIIDLLINLYIRTERAVMHGGTCISSVLSVNSEVKQGCILASSLVCACMDWVLGRAVNWNYYGVSVGNTKITALDIADHAVIVAE